MPDSTAAMPMPTTLAEAQARIHALEAALASALVGQDVTTQQRDAVVGHLPVGLLLLDVTAHVALVSDEYCRQLGLALPAMQWVGTPALALAEQVKNQFADPTAFVEDIRQVWLKQKAQAGLVLVLANHRLLERDAWPVSYRGGSGFLVSYRDVTPPHHVRHEQARVPEQNPSPVLRLGATGQRLYTNRAADALQHQLAADEYAALFVRLREAAAAALAAGQGQQLVVRANEQWFQVTVEPFAKEHYVNLYLVDVTDRHRAEEELFTQRTFYEAILNGLPAEVGVVTAEGRYQYLNPAAQPDPDIRRAAMGQALADYDRALGRPLAFTAQRLARFAQVGAGQPVEWAETVEKPGGTRHFLRRIEPGPAADGAPKWFIAYGLDVTEREQARQALAKEQAFTRQVLDTTSSMIYVRNPAGKFMFQNRALLELAAAARLHEPAPPGSARAADLARFAEVDAQVLAENAEVVADEHLTMPDGEVRWYRSVKRPLPQPGGAVYVLGVSTDITAQRQAQLTLMRSEKQYHDLIHYAQALICTCDLEGNLLSVNPSLAALLGRPVDELLGQSAATFLLAKDRANFPTYLAHIAASGTAEGVLRVQPRDEGTVRHLLYHNYVVREPGQAPYIISHAHDITARVEAEKAMAYARDEAEAAARARENFLATMSHEIRTPMNGVLGMAGQLAATPLNPHQQQLIGLLQRSGQHLLAVLNDVLDMAKISAGKLELEQASFDIRESTTAALAPLALQAAGKGLAVEGLRLCESCSHPWVVGDAHRLNQILLNLVSNAIKFTEAGTIQVAGKQVAETSNTLTVRFSVRDTGIGIAPAQQARIFDSFTQAQADTSRRYGGTGLGLSISRALVEQLGGTLTLESAVGRGSTFAFALTLPKAAAPAAAPMLTAVAPYDTGRLAGVRVLLVEDNEINRALVRMMMEPWGAVLAEAVDGPAGLSCLAAHRYDVVLMDVQMPGLSGVEATRRLRQHADPARAATPVIAFTANAFQSDIDHYLAAGMNDYLAKPFDPPALYHKLVAVLDATTTPAPLYDLSTLRRQAQGRPAFVGQVLRSLLANMPVSLAQLRAAAAAGHWPEAAAVAHHIKPNLLTLCVAGVQPALEVLTRAHHAAPGTALAPAVLAAATEHLTTVVDHVLQALPAELAALPT